MEQTVTTACDSPPVDPIATSTNSVFTLAVGYCRPSADNPLVMHSNCSSTLIRSKSGQHIVVDTLTPWHRTELLNALATHGVRPEAVAYLVCTHGHSDHVGNNGLFVHARQHIVGRDVNCADAYTLHDFDAGPLQLTDGIRVMATPGHTLQCVSVVVPDCGSIDGCPTTGTGTVVIAGDLFERKEDIEDESLWLEAGTQNAEAQRVHRCRVADLAAHIVPGHGPMFAVTDGMRGKLLRDVECREPRPCNAMQPEHLNTE